MSGIVISLIVIVVTYYLGKYAISEAHRVEKQKKFMRDMENHGTPYSKKYKTNKK